MQTDAKSQTTSFDYDALGRIIKSSPQGETASEFFFDPANHLGMLQKEIKGTAFERHYTYDGYQRPTHVTTVIDGGNKNFVHQTLYDGNYGRVKGEVSPDGLILQHTYNSLGMALQTKDVGTNKIIRLVSDFDARGNIIEQQFGEIINEFNEYTVAGLLKERCATTNASTCLGSGAPAGIQHLWYQTYDGYQRPTHVTTVIDGGNKNFVHQTLYDGNYGRVKGEVSPDGLILQHTYNSIGMALQTKDVGTNKIIRLVSDFDARGNIIEQQFGEIINEFNEYTVAGLLKERCATTNASTCLGSGAPAGIQHLWYQTYDGYGNLTYLQNLEIGQQEGFVYDDLHRLTQSNRTWDNYTPVTQHETINYDYDGVGNLTNKRK